MITCHYEIIHQSRGEKVERRIADDSQNRRRITDLNISRVGYLSAVGSGTNTFYSTFYATMRNNELAYVDDQIRLRRRVHC